MPVIKELKDQGIDRGKQFRLSGVYRQPERKSRRCAAENVDRKLVYEAIAKKQGTTPEVVGKHRAAQIADKALPGEWLQDANGKWYKKK